MISLLCGIVCIAYGFVVLSAGSGTSFWKIWEYMGALCVLFFLFKRFGFFERIPKGLRLFGACGIGIVVTAILIESMLIWIAAHPKESADLDYVIVLGAQIKDDGPSVVLRYRLDKAVEYLNANPECKCVVSGGQCYNENMPEADGMRDYLVQQGIDVHRILCEEKSQNTKENLLFSRKILDQQGVESQKIGIITNDFHLFRAVAIAKKQGFPQAVGICAPSSRHFLPNNVFRECLGVVKDFFCGNL